ncbi:immunoglobulin-like domain-containing protein [Alkalibacterium olivapovliticus]|uniref:Bacterial Ig-like domain-containing protein n=1 Tax=Alkalibacterium olivapovliticus TaxID=99907 RepID=A0A2T0W9Z8_9LACT|nr:immunoglobulin-like domain-containing protein [Alkalibacterium olivapovliticus]PRY83517.1 hypothetical protein CLV38_104123 [Alkalibacterium olivapovliticus]
MLKSLVKLSAIVFLGFILVACGENREPSPFEEVNTLEGVELQLNESVYDRENDTFLLTVINNSEQEVTYGVAFTVEKHEDDQWVMVEPEEEMAFILIAHILQPGEESEEELFMEYYEPFEEGEYRVVRQLEGEVLTAEFSVE